MIRRGSYVDSEGRGCPFEIDQTNSTWDLIVVNKWMIDPSLMRSCHMVKCHAFFTMIVYVNSIKSKKDLGSGC